MRTPRQSDPSGVPAKRDDPIAWGIHAQTGVLRDVLLGKPDEFRWVPLNSISAVTFSNQEAMGYRLDKPKAILQHQRMVEAYRAAGVRCHFVEADEGLPSSVFVRDSSFMTPWGAVVASVQTPPRRRDYAVV